MIVSKALRNLRTAELFLDTMSANFSKVSSQNQEFDKFLSDILSDTKSGYVNLIETVGAVFSKRVSHETSAVKTSRSPKFEDVVALSRSLNIECIQFLQEVFLAGTFTDGNDMKHVPEGVKSSVWDLVNNSMLLDITLSRAAEGNFEVYE